ncbi:MAG TPA: sigma-70 family RNA polymerase sigma factor [Streptomyces sp.]|nr:sigma-70 family RNA polymerase sigma factor [Streptomyces sp.]
MEDAAAAELRVGAPAAPAPAADLQGRDLAEVLHQAHYPGLVRFLLLHGASWNEAQDAAQDAFTQMCRPGTSIRFPKAWLRKVAWRSWLRQQVQEEPCAEVPDSATEHWQSPAYAAELGVEERHVIELLLKLPAKQRAALAWTMDGFTTQESAEAMGITPVAARQNLARARATLKAELALEAEKGSVEVER